MATLTESLSSSAKGHLRPLDVLRDLRAVADLVEICFAETLDADGRSYLQRMRSIANQPGLVGWVAATAEWASVPLNGYIWLQDDRLVGNVNLIPYFIRGRRFYLIANVAVHPDYRRQGIARSLTAQAVEHARQRGAPSVWLHVREENEGAVMLYRSLGFIERARRTTWYSTSDYTPAQPLKDIKFIPPRPQDWSELYGWLTQNYPPEVTWYMSFKANILRPGIVGSFYRFFNNAFIQQWSAVQGERMLGSLAWQASMSHANTLWLAAPPDIDESVLHALLIHARYDLATKRTLMLDYPARLSSLAIREAGFYEHQTLIWMELDLS